MVRRSSAWLSALATVAVGCGAGTIADPFAESSRSDATPLLADTTAVAADTSVAALMADDGADDTAETSGPDTSIDTSPPEPADVALPGCAVTMAGGAGAEPSGAIPVCCTPEEADKTEIMEAFRLLNEHRVANGKPELTYEPLLELSIQGHCQHMRTHPFFAHAAPEPAVAAFTTRGGLCGHSAAAENIASGYPSASSVIAGWKGSPGHNANMLGGFRTVGIGKAGSIWGQVFGY